VSTDSSVLVDIRASRLTAVPSGGGIESLVVDFDLPNICE
jgi:hypothetical protein